MAKGNRQAMKALVTGGAGFIGSNLADALIDRGDDVIMLDNLSTGRHANLDRAISRGAQLVVEDIRDERLVKSLLVSERPDIVYHLAAQIDVRVSASRPAYDAEINVIGTINLLQAALEAKVGRFLYASTGGAIYGDVDRIPTAEEGPILPEAPYGQAKYAGEGYCGLWQRMHDLSTVSLRFGNVYGPRQDPLGEAGVIAIFCGRLVEGKRPTIFGDGKQTRDYIYVEDLIECVLAAADSEVHGALNVGTGIETSVLDLTGRLQDLGAEFGLIGPKDFKPEFAPARLGELQRSCLDPAKARELLGFEATTGIQEGLRTTLASVLPTRPSP